MIIAVPSKNRAGKTTTQNIVPNAIFYVPESEVHQYEDAGIKNIISVPPEIEGITQTRNFILKSTKEMRVVFLDDDVKYAGYRLADDEKMLNIERKDEEFWIDEFQKFFDLTEQHGFKIWGVKTESSSRSVYPFKPINFKTYVTGSCMGMINDGEYYFDENFKVKEDYEICLRHIKDKGGILGIRYLHWECHHWDTDGGCKDYRTIDMERDAIEKLVQLYPSMISSAKRKASMFTIKLNL